MDERDPVMLNRTAIGHMTSILGSLAAKKLEGKNNG